MAKEEAKALQRKSIPFATLLLTGASCYAYYCWNTWPLRKSRQNLVFTETNFLNMKRYWCILTGPLSFENNFYFYANLPGIAYAALITERAFGPQVLIAAYLANCAASALSTVVYQRQVGYKVIQQRGRLSNFNGNLGLFLSTMFATAVP
jgi:hypothetical protein